MLHVLWNVQIYWSVSTDSPTICNITLAYNYLWRQFVSPSFKGSLNKKYWSSNLCLRNLDMSLQSAKPAHDYSPCCNFLQIDEMRVEHLSSCQVAPSCQASRLCLSCDLSFAEIWTPMVYTETVASALTSDCNHAFSWALKHFYQWFSYCDNYTKEIRWHHVDEQQGCTAGND